MALAGGIEVYLMVPLQRTPAIKLSSHPAFNSAFNKAQNDCVLRT